MNDWVAARTSSRSAVAAVVVAEAERHYYGGVVLEQPHLQDVAATSERATGR